MVGDLQVDIIELELLQARVKGGGDVGDGIKNFGGDEELFASYAAILDGDAYFLLGSVGLGAINVGEAMGDGRL